MAEIAIETWGLSKQFFNRRNFSLLKPFGNQIILSAVDDVNLKIERGEVFGLLGANGAGKTTLAKMLCTLILPSSGGATIAGYDLLRQPQKVRKTIAFISSDERSFYWRLSGRRNLAFFASLQGIPPKKAAMRINELLSQVGLQEAADRRFQEYSNGMKQRLSIARGLLADPEIFFFDEPAKGLDPAATKEIYQFVKGGIASQGKTVIMATHDLSAAEQNCDKIGIMSHGRLQVCSWLSQLA